MKKLILTFALILTCSAYTMQAQRVSVNINIGSQPAWGPVGYDYVDYYYMPDIYIRKNQKCRLKKRNVPKDTNVLWFLS